MGKRKKTVHIHIRTHLACQQSLKATSGRDTVQLSAFVIACIGDDITFFFFYLVSKNKNKIKFFGGVILPFVLFLM